MVQVRKPSFVSIYRDIRFTLSSKIICHLADHVRDDGSGYGVSSPMDTLRSVLGARCLSKHIAIYLFSRKMKYYLNNGLINFKNERPFASVIYLLGGLYRHVL